MQESKSKTVLIKFIGGPKDGAVAQLKKPYSPLLYFKSQFRADVVHEYEFDENKNNVDEPFAYTFKGYQKKS